MKGIKRFLSLFVVALLVAWAFTACSSPAQSEQEPLTKEQFHAELCRLDGRIGSAPMSNEQSTIGVLTFAVVDNRITGFEVRTVGGEATVERITEWVATSSVTAVVTSEPVRPDNAFLSRFVRIRITR